MRSVTLVDATDLEAWANRRDAQDALPRILRRLVHATVARAIRVGFPSGEGVQLGGWDGVVVVDEGNTFVPDGVSVWELGTGKDIKGKADGDYEKRRGNPRGIDPANSTFVFVTPRRWGGKARWVAAREGERIWRAVRAYDADDLEAWLELAPAVHVWLSILLGKHPENAVDLGTWWADWTETTNPPTSPEFILSGRGEAVEKVHAWLRDPSAPLALQAESRDEAMAVFAAAVQQLPPDERVTYLARALVVRDLPAWHRLAALGESLILVPVFESPEAIARAARGGHRVVVALGRADSASGMTLVVPRLTQEGATKVLLAAGVPEERARELAVLARRSFMSFRRRLAVRPEIEQPEWARPGQARSLLPALLAGSWSDANEADREALATLARVPYHEVSEIAVRWSNESDPPARRIGDTWFIVSREDGWSLLARYLTRDDLERLEAVVLDVLGGPDPRFDLPESERWMARALGRAPRHSDALRRGLAETLAVMGARGETVTVSTGASPSRYAARIVRRLLERANTDWRLWASLSPVLPLLAEAAPDEFLTAVGQGLSGAEPVLLKLFAEQTDPLFGSSPHTGLLWALETVAWSPEHLGHAASLLANLARLDPGGRLANRPMNSLRGIFLLWHPQTTAGLAQRLSVLDMLRRSEPDVAWELLRQLLPEHHGIGFNTATPSWRDWAAGPPRVTRGEYVKAVREITSRMLADADQSGLRWETLIEALARLPVDQHEAIVSRLAGMEVDRLGSKDRALIWNALRRLISQHRSFADADWALPAERVDRLEEIHRRFEPVEPVGRYAWLFSDRPELPDGGEQDIAAYREAIAQARLAAVRSIHAEGGLPALLECARHAERPGEFGVTLGQTELVTGQEDQVLGEFLGADDRVLAEVARGFAAGRVSRRGREWAETKLAGIAGTWSPAQRAELLACLPCDPRTWDLAAGSGSETEQGYWRLVNAYWIPDPRDAVIAAGKLAAHGRPYTAVKLLGLHARRRSTVPPRLLVEVLESAVRTSPAHDRPLGDLAHDVARLLDALEPSDEVDATRIAALEWAYLPLVGRHERAPKLLHRELSRNPAFFAEIVALAYRAEGEEPRELSEEDRARARHAYELLDTFRVVPGTTDDGGIDGAGLKAWVQHAREALATSGRAAVGDHKIGEALSGSPAGADGAWPHPAVRDVIEDIKSVELERGFEIAVYNSRGVVSKDPREGGAQERQLADRYTGFAAAIADRWPRTAAMLRRIAEGYRAEARREDEEAELGEDLGR